MKLLITIVQAYDSDRLLRAITSAGLGATKINSVGGFLRMTNATILMAMEEERVPEAIGIIRSTAKRRVEVKVDAVDAQYSEYFGVGFHEVPIGGGIVFTLPMDAMYHVWPDHILKHEKTPV